MQARLLLCFSAALLISSLKGQRCPPSNRISSSQTGRTCTNDRQCLSGQKCCPTLYGRLCVSLSGSSGGSAAWGRCSDGRNPLQSCNPGVCPPNYKCEDGKCCWNNPYAEPPDSGNGVCRDGSRPSGRCINQVCSGNQECYRGWCCQRTSSSTTGLCFDGSVSFTRCTFGKCPSGLRCENGWCCFNSAQVPQVGNQKKGTCPPYLSIPGVPTADKCLTDMECEGSRKCCGTAAGKACLYPEM
uniref:WAP domain-containing protein n=1 Tax=Trichuris muris TaxID=70415 RepID=A0A5S6QXY8_TRIMR